MNNETPIHKKGSLRVFTSRKYRVTELNPWDYVGAYKVLASGRHWSEDEEDACDRFTDVMVIEANITGPFTEDDEPSIEQIIKDTFNHNACEHDYDCCGCRSYYAWPVKHIKDNLWYVEVHSSRNY